MQIQAGKYTISVTTQEKTAKVEGVWFGNFGMHLDDYGVVITHIPSGCKVPGGPWKDLMRPVLLIQRLEEMAVDWSSSRPELTPETVFRLNEILTDTRNTP